MKITENSENKRNMKSISEHISYYEATFSLTAIRKGIANVPNATHLANMQALAIHIFEPLRHYFGVPIKINSMFRSLTLNRSIGGASHSQHCKGQAMDIDDTLGGITNAVIFQYIKDNLPFDQLIWEFGARQNPSWVHVSYKSNGKNRGQILRAYSKNGKTHYEKFS